MVREKLALLLVFGVLVGLTGCASPTVKKAESSQPNQDATPESIVSARAQSRWDALIKGDVTAVYNYLSPDTRNTVSLLSYSKTFRLGAWVDAAVDSVECEASRCIVTMRVGMKTAGGKKPIDGYVSEVWVNNGASSDWWYVIR